MFVTTKDKIMWSSFKVDEAEAGSFAMSRI
jgi:hypothetical protein